MADTVKKYISKVSLGGAIYHLKDKEARELISSLASPLLFKGVVSTASEITSLPDYKKGWTYKAGGKFSLGSQNLEIGDMLICIEDFNASYKQSDWTVLQSNLDIVQETGSSTATVMSQKAVTDALDGKLNTSGGVLTGNLTGKYLTGTWLQTTSVTSKTDADKIAVIDPSGWIYYIPKDTLFTQAPTFTGTSTNSNGAKGLVPAPITSNVNHYLKGNGTWDQISSNEIDFSTTEFILDCGTSTNV